MRVRALLALLLGVFAAPAFAASILGQVTSSATGTGISGVLVSAYTLGAKGWSVSNTRVTDVNGNYAFTLPAGNYLVRAAPSNTTTQCLLTERYFDVAAPAGNGAYEEAADVISLASAGSAVTGINIAMLPAGAFDGRVTNQGGTGLNGLLVRVEQRSDSRIHFDTTTSTIGGVAGSFSACGLFPGSYLFWIHDPASQFADVVQPGPFVASAGGRQSLGAFIATNIASDPNEPNPSTTTSTPVPVFATSWDSTGAIITPRGSDLDFYCLDALAGDVFEITTSTTTVIIGEPRSSPWVDPLVGWFRASPPQLLTFFDDDLATPGSLNSRVRTGAVPADGRYCAGVTTFGDPDFNGSGQVSAGRYGLRIALVGDAVFADGFEG